MIFSEKELARLNRSCPMLGGVKLGNKLEKLEKGELETEVFFPIIIEYEVTIGAASGLEIFNADAPFDFEILDVIIQARGTVTGGTMQLKGADVITDAIVCATDNAIDRAGTIDDDYSTISKGDTLEIVCASGNGIAGVKGLVTILAVKR